MKSVSVIENLFKKLERFDLKNKKPLITNDLAKIVTFALWLLVNSFFLIKNGIVTTGEAAKYIGQANNFVQTGHLSYDSLSLYFTQIALLSFCIKLKLSFAIAVIVQLFINLLATFCFFRALELNFSSTRIALIGTIILLLNYPYQEFNTFLQTESLFYSFTLILSCYLIGLEKMSVKSFTAISCLLFVVSITRPTGLLFIPPVCIYLFFKYCKKISLIKKIGIISSIAAIFFFILNKALGIGGELDLMLPFRDERIICGVPTLPDFLNIKTTSNGNSLFGLLYYITHNTGQFIRLGWLRTFAFFGLYRNYFSAGHNFLLIVYFYSIHVTAVLGFSYWIQKYGHKLLYFLSIIFLNWLTVVLTCDDWHNRFYLSISPYIIVLSMGFVYRQLKLTNDKR